MADSDGQTFGNIYQILINIYQYLLIHPFPYNATSRNLSYKCPHMYKMTHFQGYSSQICLQQPEIGNDPTVHLQGLVTWIMTCPLM